MKPQSTPHKFYFLIAVILLCFQHAADARIIYVNISATGAGNGSSWTDAFTLVQDAIDISSPGDTICVAEGEYLPTHLRGIDSTRSLTFYINKSILLFGGFSGTPGSEGNFNERNPILNRTILSGDSGLPGNDTDNAFHVVYIDHVSDSMRLDGFVISLGNSIGAAGLDAYGAGIYNDAIAGRSNPSIYNCDLCINKAAESGGGMMNYAGEGGTAVPVLVNCLINENDASAGGGISNYTENGGVASPTLINCKFTGNEAPTAQGGAMNSIAHSGTSSPVMINSVVTGNDSPTSAAFFSFVTGTGHAAPELINCAFSGNTGGSIRIVDLGAQTSLVKIRNSILWGNTGGAGLTTNGATADVSFSLMQFGFPGEGNIADDPLFVSQPVLDGAHPDGDLHLQDNSPAIDAGSNVDVVAGIQTDLDNLPRFVNPFNGDNGTVDIGPFEIQSIATGTSNILANDEWTVYPNPAKNQINISIPENQNAGSLQLLNASGNVIDAMLFPQGQQQIEMKISQLPAGNYFIHIMIYTHPGKPEIFQGSKMISKQ